MGKKSRRPARRQKKPTLDDLDDDTAKPNEPLSAENVHATTYLQVNYHDQGIHSSQINVVEFREGVRASWRALSEGLLAADQTTHLHLLPQTSRPYRAALPRL